MMGKTGRKIAMAALVGAAGVMISGTTAMAGTKPLVDRFTGLDSGWTASWSDAYGDLVGITVDHVDLQNNVVYIEKSVNFTDDFINTQGGFIDPALITFTQTSSNAVLNIVINDESITNHTGSDWDSFSMFLMNGDATFNPANSSGFNLDGFANMSFVDGNRELDITNGGVANGDVWYPGSGAGLNNWLWINVNPTGQASFDLKEQPHAIPLPAAAWSGLSGLVGLALLGSRKKLRSLIA